MTVLLLRLAGPMQSWGVRSRFNTRGTGTEPSKSGVVGMLASALGRSREESVEDLNALRFGTRTDQVGRMMSDFHISKHPTDPKRSYLGERFYLEDAVFLAGLEGDGEFLEVLEEAVCNPVHPLFLGRRSCPPSGKVSMGLHYGRLEDVLHDADWQAAGWYRRNCPADVCLEGVFDSLSGYTGSVFRDVPTSFSQIRRVYRPRDVSRDPLFRLIDNTDSRRYREIPTTHDPFSSVGGV